MNLKSQNLKATFEWIKIAVESNSPCFLSLSTDSTELIVTHEPSSENFLGLRQTIPLNQMRNAQFEQNEDIVRLEIKCASDKCVHIEFKAQNEKEYSSKFTHNVIILSILFKKNVDADMKKRILKAFNHLIVLNGGAVLDNKF